jgi:hypothetical protein
MDHHASAAVALLGSGSPAAEDTGRTKTMVVIVAVVFVVGVIFQRLVVPTVRALIRLLEWTAELALKIGLGLMAAGAVTAAVLVLYAMSSLGGG